MDITFKEAVYIFWSLALPAVFIGFALGWRGLISTLIISVLSFIQGALFGLRRTRIQDETMLRIHKDVAEFLEAYRQRKDE